MKKSNATNKKAPAKKSAAAKVAAQASSVRPKASSSAKKKPLVVKQPQSKQNAATQAGIFLYTDDAWALAYFNADDLHCMERDLFG